MDNVYRKIFNSVIEAHNAGANTLTKLTKHLYNVDDKKLKNKTHQVFKPSGIKYDEEFELTDCITMTAIVCSIYLTLHLTQYANVEKVRCIWRDIFRK